MARTIERPGFQAPFREAVVGKSEVDMVRLCRFRPLIRNSFNPYFNGSFEVRDAETVLEGHFSTDRATKVFVVLYFGFLLLFLLSSAIYVLADPAAVGKVTKGAGIMIGMLIFGVILVAVGNWSTKGDREVITKVIQDSIGANGAQDLVSR